MAFDELHGSVLGTRDYWDANYDKEIANYKDYGDTGEIWFDEDAQVRIITWIIDKSKIPIEKRIIDVGCGNGMFLIQLYREGYRHLVGVDYSAKAIELASSIAKDRNLHIEYIMLDMVDATASQAIGTFDIVHDKGTYDAISLNPDNPKAKREAYMDSIAQIMNKDGKFIITSCNWTEEELVNAFQRRFVKFDVIPTPVFRFGGKVGTVVTSIVFQKKLTNIYN